MKKLLVLAGLGCLLSTVGSAQAQTRARVFDNFDTSGGVQVVAPKPPANLATAPSAAKKPAQKSAENRVQTVDDLARMKNKVKKTSLSSYVAPPRMVMSAGSSLGAFTTGDQTIDSYIVESSLRYNVDPLLIYAQMHQESSFKLKATSYKGARGLMQLMPATALRFGVTNIYDPRQNIDAGVKYMRWLLNTFNQDMTLALAGYNAGEGAVMKYGYQIPPYNETREYVRRITSRYNAIKNPNVAKAVKKVTTEQVAKMEQKAPPPLDVYERNALTVRLPDGRMRLVNP